MTIISLLIGTTGTGGLVYLIVDKKVMSAKDKVDAGMGVVDLYKEIDTIVSNKTKPLEKKIDILTEKLAIFGCSRSNCSQRLYSSNIKETKNE